MTQPPSLEAPQGQPGPEPQALPQPPLTMEERNDLRQRVLAGYKMSIDEAKRVYETLRVQQGAVVITGETTAKKARKPKKESYSDTALDADLAGLGL